MAKKNDFSYEAIDEGTGIIEADNQEFINKAFVQSSDITPHERRSLYNVHDNVTKSGLADAGYSQQDNNVIEQAIDDLIAAKKLNSSNEDSVFDIPTDKLVPCRNEWNVFADFPRDRKIELIESIIKFGVWHSIVVRATDNTNTKFEVLSGNNRTQGVVDAYTITGDTRFKTIKAKVYLYDELSDEDAHAIVVMSNYIDRKEMSTKDKFSSSIFLYNYYQKQKNSGKTSIENIAEYLSSKSGLSVRTFYNRVSLRTLIPQFFTLMSDKKINMTTAFNLCKIPKEHQEKLYEAYYDDDVMLSKAAKLYKKSIDMSPEKLVEEASKTLLLTEKQKNDIKISERTYSITASRSKEPKETGYLIFVPPEDNESIRSLLENYIVSVMD